MLYLKRTSAIMCLLLSLWTIPTQAWFIDWLYGKKTLDQSQISVKEAGMYILATAGTLSAISLLCGYQWYAWKKEAQKKQLPTQPIEPKKHKIDLPAREESYKAGETVGYKTGYVNGYAAGKSFAKSQQPPAVCNHTKVSDANQSFNHETQNRHDRLETQLINIKLKLDQTQKALQRQRELSLTAINRHRKKLTVHRASARWRVYAKKQKEQKAKVELAKREKVENENQTRKMEKVVAQAAQRSRSGPLSSVSSTPQPATAAATAAIASFQMTQGIDTVDRRTAIQQLTQLATGQLRISTVPPQPATATATAAAAKKSTTTPIVTNNSKQKPVTQYELDIAIGRIS